MKKQYKVVLITIVFIILGCILIYQQKYTSTTKYVSSQEKTIKIGLVAALSGDAASFGQSVLAGAELAVSEINLDSQNKITLITEDSACDSVKTVNAFKKLIEVDNVDLIIGPTCSTGAPASLTIATEANIPVIINSASAPDLTKTSDLVFRVHPSDSLAGKAIANFTKRNIGEAAAVLYVNNAWGESIAKLFDENYKSYNGFIVYHESVNEGQTDIKSQLLKIMDTKPDVIFMPVYTKTAINGLKQAKDVGIPIPIIGGEIFGSEEVISVKSSEGALFAQAILNNPESFIVKIHNQENWKNIKVNYLAPLTYDAVYIAYETINKVGTNPDNIKQELKNTVYTNGVSNNKIEFDENGDLKNASYEIRIIQGGKSVPYAP